MLLSLLATLAGLYALHAFKRLHALVVIGLAVVASAAQWIMVVRTERLPFAMTALSQKDAAIHRPVALSARELFWIGDTGLVRVELPSLRIFRGQGTAWASSRTSPGADASCSSWVTTGPPARME